MINRVKATHAQPARQWVSCNVCREVCPRPVLTAKSAISQFDLCAGCAEKLGYDVGDLHKKADEVRTRESINREEKKLAFKQNKGISHFRD